MAPSGPSAKETQLAEAKAAKAAKAAAAKAELAEASAAKAVSSSSRQSLNSEIWPMAKRLATAEGLACLLLRLQTPLPHTLRPPSRSGPSPRPSD